jgi:hypothetical protein
MKKNQIMETADNRNCSGPMFCGSSSVALPSKVSPPIKEITTTSLSPFSASKATPKSKSDLDTFASDLTPSTSSKEEAAGRIFFNILERNKRMEDIVTGIVSKNVTDLLFLSVFGETPTGRATARYFYPTQNNITAAVAALDESDIFDSPIHNRRIHISKFKTFLTKHCSRKEKQFFAVLMCFLNAWQLKTL